MAVDVSHDAQRFARKFGAPLAEWLLSADTNNVAAILEASDKVLLKDALSRIGLRKRWQQIQFKSKPYATLAPVFVNALRGRDSAERGSVAAQVVFTWWGRLATLVFANAQSSRTLLQTPLPFRYADVVTRASEGSNSQVRAELEPLVEGVHRDLILDRLFSTLWKAGIETLSADQLRTELGLDVGPDDSPERTIDTSSQEQLAGPTARVDTGSQDEQVHTPIFDQQQSEDPSSGNPLANNELPVTVEPTTMSAVGAPTTRGNDPFSELSKRLERCHVLTSQIPTLLQSGAHADAEVIFSTLRTARKDVDAEIHRLSGEVESFGLTLPIAPPDAYASAETASKYISAIAEVFRVAESRSQEQVQVSKSRLLLRFAAVGLDVPLDVTAIATAQELAAASHKWGDTLALEEAYGRLREFRDVEVPDDVSTLTAESRLRLYERLLSLPPSEHSTDRLVYWVVSDSEALVADRLRGKSLLSALIVNALDKYLLPLPAHTWETYSLVAGPSASSDLFAGTIGHVIVSAIDAGLIDLARLMAMPGFEHAELPEVVRRAVLRHKFAALPSTTPVAAQASLALQTPLDGQLIATFIERLIESGEHPAAMLLTLLAVRCHILAEIPRAVSDTFARTLIAAVAGRPELRELVRQLLEQDSDWLVDIPDGIPALLFLSAETGAQRPMAELPYLAQDALELATQRRPALVQRWLLERRLSNDPAASAEREQLLLRGHAALSAWDHDLQRPSCYTNWEFAADYQKILNERLVATFRALDAGQSDRVIDAQEWIDDVENTATRLPKVEGKARQNMISYLEAQKQRLEVLAACRLSLPRTIRLREALRSAPEPLGSALIAELEREPAASLVRPIYEAAIASAVQ